MSKQSTVRRGATLLGMCLAAAALSACQSSPTTSGSAYPNTTSGAMGASGADEKRAPSGPGTVMPSGTQGGASGGASGSR